MFGPARVTRDGPTGDASTGNEPTWQEVGARKPRSVLAALAMYAGWPVSADVLADLVWAGEPPRAAHGALHAYISGVRKALDPERTTRSVESVRVDEMDRGEAAQLLTAGVGGASGGVVAGLFAVTGGGRCCLRWLMARSALT